jgi:dUTP pyrophosphatase
MPRGFKVVKEAHKQHAQTVALHGEKVTVHETTALPVRSDAKSAGYDFHSPIDFLLHPGEKRILFTNVKAFMEDDEVLSLYPRSSMGIKKGLMLSNTVGIIDSSYYENESNDGNIGLPLLNTSGKGMEIKRGDRLAQGIFTKYLLAEGDAPTSDARTGGFGSTGE